MPTDDAWRAQAKCREVDNPDSIFFPHADEKYQRVDYRPAKRICKTCPVRMSCLAYSIAHNVPYGVWGGFTAGERRTMSKETRTKLRKAWWAHHPISRSA